MTDETLELIKVETGKLAHRYAQFTDYKDATNTYLLALLVEEVGRLADAQADTAEALQIQNDLLIKGQ